MKKVLLYIETSREFGRELLFGITKYTRLHEPWSFFLEASGLKSSMPRFSNIDADGIILRSGKLNKKIIDMNLPTIIALHYPERPAHLPVILTDGQSIAELAANHLVNLGLKNFAYCGFDILSWSIDRKMHFSNYINNQNLNLFVYSQPGKGKQCPWYKERGHLRKWIQSLPKPVGIMACNDDRGQHILETCKSLNIKIPEEVAVIGVDNDEVLCELSDPPLTSVAMSTETAGYKAAELLNSLMNGEPMNGQELWIYGTHVVQRLSTDLIYVDDDNVSAAVQFIRQNAKKDIQVKDVVGQTCLSRRSLEEHFKKKIHRTIHEEIKRVRIDLMAKLLVETNLSISEIAEMFEFTGIEHISRYFKSEKGIGLKEYRARFKMN